MKFFQSCRNLPELKAEYKKLAKQFHPDMGGTDEIMAQINNEYDNLAKILPNVNMAGEEYQPTERENSEAFRNAINAIIHCEGIEIELCGSWLWITGNTILYKETLKKAGYKWSAKKIAWYWHDEGYRKVGRKTYGLQEIRSMWGSEKIETEKVEKFA